MNKYQIPPKIEKHLKKNDRFWRNLHRKKKVIAFITYSIALTCFVLIGKSCWDGYWRTYQWTWQVPVVIEFRAPLIIKKLKPMVIVPVISATNAPEGKIEPKLEYSEEFEKAYATVRLHESSEGRNKKGLNGVCIAQGMLNEIGFAPHESYCFTSPEDQKATFMLWLKNRYGIPCVKQGFCRASIGDLLMLYSSGAYSK